MDFYYKRRYHGSVKLVIFDWAGTIIDFGSVAPAGAFIEGFHRKAIDITIQQAREPMGMEKRAHIQAISQMEPVAAQWQKQHNRSINAEDIDQMYEEFVPVLLDVLADHSELIPGTVETVNHLRQMGLQIGSTTGYFDEALTICMEAAERQGFVPDFAIGATQVPAGRPAPWLIYETMKRLGAYPIEAVVKVGDTVPDIEAGLNAGVWSVGVAQTGNEVGLAEAEWMELDEDEKMQKLESAVTNLSRAGAHYVVDTIADIPEVVAEINRRLASGERP